MSDATTGATCTIGELFENPRTIKVHSLGRDLKLRARQVVDIVCNGTRPVFRIRTRQGFEVRATANHPFRTIEGWQLL